MGWWPFGKNSVDAKPLPKERQQQHEEEAAALKRLAAAGGSGGGAGGEGGGGAKPVDLLAGALPRPTSIFEFGKPAPVSAEHLVGNCAGDNPDAIQACVWTMEPLQGKPREKRPMYRIEF